MPREKYPPPPLLDAEAERLWRSTRKKLEERGDLDEPTLEAIERYVRSDQLEREAIAERASALTAEGSTGQLVAHPLIAVERAARGDADDYARELLLTPRSQKASADKDDPGGNGGSGLDGAFG